MTKSSNFSVKLRKYCTIIELSVVYTFCNHHRKWKLKVKLCWSKLSYLFYFSEIERKDRGMKQHTTAQQKLLKSLANCANNKPQNNIQQV